MKVSYNWLKKYVATEKSPQELDKILTDTGLEVEGVEEVEAIKGGLAGVVIGEVVACEKHPDADKLNVTQVNVGEAELLTIVCGAPNVAKGQKVVVAIVGSTLYPTPDEPFKIKKAKIRGVESFGMICAEDELGIGVSHDGIMVLPVETPVGMPASRYFKLESDYLLEIGLTPNRSDAMGHVGVARDIVAFQNIHENAGLTLNLPSVDDFKVDNQSLVVDVAVEDASLAPRYAGVSISGITIQPSPDWLKNTLLMIGLTPINNVVDVTNYVLHELGTPLHAFDSRAVNGRIVVKEANEGEEFITLDGEKRTLTARDLMITNGKENLCLAGIFGGLHSGVKEDTTALFLEAAYFNPVTIRKSAKHHGLNTDASFRFERGVDPNNIEYALKRAALLIQEVAGGKISMNPVDLYPTKIERLEVDFSYERCNKLIGNVIPEEKVNAIFHELDLEVLSKKDGIARIAVPTYRTDVTREADIIEEVLRIYGFNAIKLPEKLNMSLGGNVYSEAEHVQGIIADLLASNGVTEMMNNSLTQEGYVAKWGGEVLKEEANVRMLNPLSNELGVMRQSLIFQALEAVSYNQNRQHSDVKLFEFGKTYHKYSESYSENKRLLIVLAGRKEQEQWNTSNDTVSYYTIKGIVDAILNRLGLTAVSSVKGLKKSLLADGIQINLLKRKLGEVGWISTKLKKQFGIKNDVFVADLDWDVVLESLKLNKVKYTELPKTFAVRRDFSLLLDKSVSFAEIQEIAEKCDRKLLQGVNLFDVYEGDKLPEGKKSYAVSFSFQDMEKTLKDNQVDAVMDKIRQQLETQVKAELRS